eukprot:UN3693
MRTHLGVNHGDACRGPASMRTARRTRASSGMCSGAPQSNCSVCESHQQRSTWPMNCQRNHLRMTPCIEQRTTSYPDSLQHHGVQRYRAKHMQSDILQVWAQHCSHFSCPLPSPHSRHRRAWSGGRRGCC